jgi:hypothetical protein
MMNGLDDPRLAQATTFKVATTMVATDAATHQRRKN